MSRVARAGVQDMARLGACREWNERGAGPGGSWVPARAPYLY